MYKEFGGLTRIDSWHYNLYTSEILHHEKFLDFCFHQKSIDLAVAVHQQNPTAGSIFFSNEIVWSRMPSFALDKTTKAKLTSFILDP
jgi:hypothetical protein